MKVITKAAFTYLVAALFLMVSILMVNVTEGNDAEGRTRADDYVSVNDSGLSGLYIGQSESFSIVVYNQYDGEDWIEDPYQSSHDNLYQVKIDVLYNQVRSSEGKPYPGLIQPTEIGSMTAFNGEDGEGYTIPYSRYFYTSKESDSFRFKINPIGGREGSYQIPVKITGRVQVERNTEDPSGYNWNKFQETEYLNFYIYSNVGGVENNMPLSPYEDGYTPLYAGSEYVTLQSPNFYPEYTYLENVEVELDLPSGSFYVPNPVYKIPSFTYSKILSWKVDVHRNTEPDRYVGTMRLTYYINNQRITEGPYNVTLFVAPTPLLKGPETHDMTVPTIIIDQKTPTYTFKIDFTNIGNVNIETATIRMDLDSSAFIKQQQFYFN
jgi:hypothetical protein